MPKLSAITAEHVEQALAEHDLLGRDAFLERYGFGPSRTYVLRHRGRVYDSKAIVGVAHRYATGRAASSGEFDGGVGGAARVLSELGFEVLPLSGRDAAGDRERSRVEELAQALADGDRAVRPSELVGSESNNPDGPGLYSWFVDAAGAVELGSGLRSTLGPGLIYVGQAGATKWPSGTVSGSTLRRRLQRRHLRGRRGTSTLRKTLGAVLDEARGTTVERSELTNWMHEHLTVVAVVVDDVDTLGEVEKEVVQRLAPPLNLDHAGPSDLRARLRVLRGRSADVE